MPETIHTIRELNATEQSDLIAPTTIWACVGGYADYAATGAKIAGPVPIVFADQMIAGLRALLERLGHVVVVETAADD